MEIHKFPYNWKLAEANFTKDKGKVFSCFACGGGSTMGYKLAGFDVIGCNEIDPKVNQVYVTNHAPRFNFLGDIRELRERELPPELYNLREFEIKSKNSKLSVIDKLYVNGGLFFKKAVCRDSRQGVGYKVTE